MIKTYTAYTEEIDDPEAAAAEIVEQLASRGKLLKNSVGILHAYKEFADSGTIAAVCKALPFDVVGNSTISVSTGGFISILGLTLTVLTSDDVTFHAGISASCKDGVDEPLTELYNRLVKPLPEQPKLLLTYVPLLSKIGGDEFADKLTELSGGIPAFGALSVTDEDDFSRCFTVFNGDCSAASTALVAVCGEVDPQFVSISILEENMLKHEAVVTKSTKNILNEVNGITFEEYAVSIGLINAGDMGSMLSTPVVAETPEGFVLTRTCLFGDENGGAVMCGHIPVGSTIGFAMMGPSDVTRSAERRAREVLEIAKQRENCGILFYSCAARNWSLGVSSMEEHEKVEEVIAGQVPYGFAYCGGEIFPRKLDNEKYTTLLQNATLVICVL